HDDRLAALARPADLAPDRLGGDGGAARAVDAEQDRPDIGVAEGVAERAGDRPGAHFRVAGQRACRAAALGDQPGAVDQRDRRSLVMRMAGALEIARYRDELGA